MNITTMIKFIFIINYYHMHIVFLDIILTRLIIIFIYFYFTILISHNLINNDKMQMIFLSIKHYCNHSFYNYYLFFILLKIFFKINFIHERNVIYF